MRPARVLSIALLVTAAFFTAVGPARAGDGVGPPGDGSDPRSDSGDAEAAGRKKLFDLLLGDDWKLSQLAERDLVQAGTGAARQALSLRRDLRSARARERLERVVKTIVEAMIIELGRPLDSGRDRGGAFASFGDLGGTASAMVQHATDLAAQGSELIPNDVARADLEAAGAVGRDEPRSIAETRARARAARAALASLGPAAVGFALDVPPLREFTTARTLDLLALAVYRTLATRPEKEVLAELRGVTDLATPLVRHGLADPREEVRRVFQRARDVAVEGEIAQLDQDDADRRECAEAALFRLAELSRLSLETLSRAGDRSPQVRLASARLARRVRYRLSDTLIRKLGWELEDYESRPFHERRALCLELERLGGPDAIPALRALLLEDPSTEIREVVALCLFRQQDWVGAEWLRLHGMVASPRISKEELAHIYADQGLKYLTINNYPKAERELKKALELLPKDATTLYNLACTYSRWGKLEEAIDYLGKSIEAGFDDVSHMDKDTDLDNIRDDPRTRALLDAIRRKKGLKPPGEDGE